MSISRTQRLVFLSMIFALILQFLPSIDLSDGISLQHLVAHAGPIASNSTNAADLRGCQYQGKSYDNGQVLSDKKSEFKFDGERHLSWWQKACVGGVVEWRGWYTWVPDTNTKSFDQIADDKDSIKNGGSIHNPPWNPTHDWKEGAPLGLDVLPLNTDIQYSSAGIHGNYLIQVINQSHPRCGIFTKYTPIVDGKIQWNPDIGWIQSCYR